MRIWNAAGVDGAVGVGAACGVGAGGGHTSAAFPGAGGVCGAGSEVAIGGIRQVFVVCGFDVQSLSCAGLICNALVDLRSNVRL